MGKAKRLIYGFGVNDLPYTVAGYIEGKQWVDPCYEKWRHAINRSFSKVEKAKNPTYEEVGICEEWRFASNFKLWFDKQIYYTGLHLDKDILTPGNKIYSPDKCAFVPRRVNTCILTKVIPNAKYPTGVKFNEGYGTKRYQAVVSLWGKEKSLGYYETADEAHGAWQVGKAINIEQVIAWYSEQRCFRQDVADALNSRVFKLREDAAKGVRTTML